MNSKFFIFTIIFFSSNIFYSSLKEKTDTFFYYRKNISVLVKSMTMKNIDFVKHLNSNEDQKAIYDEGAELLADIINLRDKQAASRFRMLAGLDDHESVQIAVKNITIDDLGELAAVNPIFGFLERIFRKNKRKII